MKCQELVLIINLDFKWDFFTRHGLHLNKVGKDKLPKRIASTSSSLYVKCSSSLFAVEENNNHSDVKEKDNLWDRNQINEPLHKSSRLRKPLK